MLARRHQLDQFLASVERRAFCIARLAVSDQQDALDLVQDSMIRLVEHYADRQQEEWNLLFFRILQRCIRDHYRRSRVRNRWRVWLGQWRRSSDDQEVEALTEIKDPATPDMVEQLSNERAMHKLMSLVETLPLRQQQAFVLRCWEGLSTEETAQVMGCSDGSVKTHFSRARQHLMNQLEGFAL